MLASTLAAAVDKTGHVRLAGKIGRHSSSRTIQTGWESVHLQTQIFDRQHSTHHRLVYGLIDRLIRH